MTDLHQPGRTPRTAAQLRALYEAKPSPELAAALWEIHRLQKVVLAAWERFERICLQPEAAEQVSRIAAQVMGEEPCVVAHLDSEWLRRSEPHTRYHHLAHVLERPYYRAGSAPPDSRHRVGERAAKTSASRQAKAYMEQEK